MSEEIKRKFDELPDEKPGPSHEPENPPAPSPPKK